jgi:NADH-quinone oxidoreductase subunit C
MLPALDQIKSRIEAAVPGSESRNRVERSASGAKLACGSAEAAFAVARFLRDDPDLRFDYASNVTGVDWPDLVTKEKVKVKKVVDGVEKGGRGDD